MKFTYMNRGDKSVAKQGYIKMYRRITESSVWADSDKLKLWVLCMMNASHDGYKQILGNQTIEITKGQFITGRNALSEEYNKNVKKDKKIDGLTLFRWLNIFEKLEMLNIKKTNKYTIVTVLNWDKYQTVEHQANIKRTSNEHQVNNSRTTDEQQLNTNKNDKECIRMLKNDKEGIRTKDTTNYQQIADMYNNTCVSFPRLTKLSDARKKMIKARLHTYTPAHLQQAFALAEQSGFLKGANNRNWSANFDWMLKDSNLAKILDGNYADKSKTSNASQKQLPTWFNNQDEIKTNTDDFDEEELLKDLKELRGE